MVLSGSGDKVAIIASIVPNGDANATQVSLLEMSTDDGSLTTTNLQFDSNAIDTFLQTLSSGYFLTMRLSASNMNGRYYLSMGNLLGSGLLLSFDRSEARAKVQFVSTEDLASDTLPEVVS